MARAKKCEACKKRVVKGPRARFCDATECQRARARDRRRKADLEARRQRAEAAPAGEETGSASPAGGVFSATLSELTSSGRVHTPAGQNALALAIRIDNGAEDSGSSLAALSRQHLAALAEALKDLDKVGDLGDELSKRREKRLASA
jgi:hypothetical protein